MTYREPGCGYRSVVWVVLGVGAGAGLDAAIGGLRAHWPAWLAAGVLLLAVDLLIIRATRAFKTLDVDAEQVRIGEQAVDRAAVTAAAEGADPDAPVLGWSTGMPRGRGAVTLTLESGRRVVVPTRRPEAVLAALGVAAPDPQVPVRAATPADLPVLAEIDERADAVFRVAGYDLPEVAFDDDLAAAAAVFVAGVPPVGFARVDVVDGEAHLRALAVLPGSMKQGIGGRLLEAACDWARDAGHGSISLTTYADVPWNGPFYARRGFTETTDVGPGVRALRAHEVAAGLDAVAARVVMRRPL